MARFYGTIKGNHGEATRLGSELIKTSAQSYSGSVITTLEYDRDSNLMVNIDLAPDSSSYGDRFFRGTYAEFKEMLTMYEAVRNKKASITYHREKSNKMKNLKKILS